MNLIGNSEKTPYVPIQSKKLVYKKIETKLLGQSEITKEDIKESAEDTESILMDTIISEGSERSKRSKKDPGSKKREKLKKNFTVTFGDVGEEGEEQGK